MVTTEADKDLMEETSRGFVTVECENEEIDDMMKIAENFLDGMSADVDKAEENELMDDLNLREMEEEFSEGMSRDVDETRCDELDESSLKNAIGVLVHELELKEIEIGELQIENEKLLQQNMDFKTLK